MPIYKESFLHNGLIVITCENEGAQVTEISFVIKAGSRYENVNEYGIAHLLEHIILKGTKKRPGNFVIAREVEALGGYINAFTYKEYIEILIRVSADRTERMIELVSDIVLHTYITEKEFNFEKDVVIRESHRKYDDHNRYLTMAVFKQLFGDCPLGHDSLESEELISNLNIETVFDFKDRLFAPERSSILVSGPLSHETIVELVDRHFREWVNPLLTASRDYPKPIPKEHFKFLERSIKETKFQLTYPVFRSLSLREYVVYAMLLDHLSYGLSSLLFQELRVKKQLVYSVSASIWNYSDASLACVTSSTTKPKEAIKVVEETIYGLSRKLEKKLLIEMKDRELGLFAINFNPLFASGFLKRGVVNYRRLVSPDEYKKEIQSVELDHVESVLTVLNKENLFITVLGPKDQTQKIRS